MQRDMDLIRLLLLKVEALPIPVNSMGVLREADLGDLEFSHEEIAYHWNLIVEAGLIEQPGNTPKGLLAVRRLTWKGHDFVDSVRDDDVWQKTRKGALAAGGMSIDLVADLAKGFIRKKVAELTGIEL
ncbi:DUF2513 domain-containing protein [Pseudomonas sp. NPDC047961]